MPLPPPSERAEYLIRSLEDHGQGDYIGESINQLEHSLQTAHQAQKSGARSDLVLAALLHDIGQIIPLAATKEARMTLKEDSPENVGRIGHESIGAEFLRSLGFGDSVCRLVGSHVDAKRYLTAVSSDYMDTLSSASKKSLQFQGGPFRGEELECFRNDPLRDEMVALRLWDDAAKVPHIEQTTPRAREYLSLVVEHLQKEEGVVV
ncbi:hypothetical protein ASPVEDRAFT_839351 [Aspergillus versicolor CBS 583.65]|uniref:HD domain-containing protein n=1 Tax=Aspergillus versicolor CBS 583.65 TaxID=1036611 RepID=A0A1L9PUT7_ASPVE|nr:uncharacterized protein ASPVEDRAFT_839351 [Aspergillus versicolor CBS 583.65]OJJ05314.1 hypothetical protein ASPVEDRAFT_839351 [Aspergillus versicolor CBS 583.65]